MAAFDRCSSLKCKFQLRDKHEEDLSICKQKQEYEKNMKNDYII